MSQPLKFLTYNRKLFGQWKTFHNTKIKFLAILLEVTNQVLHQAALPPIVMFLLMLHQNPKNMKIPVKVSQAKQRLSTAHNVYKNAVRNKSPKLSSATDSLKSAKKLYRLEIRQDQHSEIHSCSLSNYQVFQVLFIWSCSFPLCW